jgi:predicted ATPase/DNA-binding CsgD family transcriptional regulator
VTARQHNLPAPHTQLFGRRQDCATVRDLILETPGRLVTLTGTGGCGKTQLALLVATSLIETFPDGVRLVDLASVQTAQLVPTAMISALGVREQPNETPLQTLVDWVGARRVLLVLDNCEHLLDACAQLATALLDGCPNLRLLTTSREPLRISGERVWRVPSLGVPEPGSTLLPDQVTRFPSVQMFVQRAQAIRSGFMVSARNAAVVGTICAHLEGLPLAIELAAAWVRVLDVEQILERLDDTFGLLVGGSRTAPTRQHTMRATMDWSYGLLTDAERVVFQRLAVFVGGWSLEAAENVCSGGTVERPEMLAYISRLVDASLIQVDEREERPRYRLLEPVRQYALLYLRESGELEAARRQHATYFLSYALFWETDANYGGPGRRAALAALDREQDNLRATLRWCLDYGEAEQGIFLARALWTPWVLHGLNTEGRSWLAPLAALPGAAQDPALRAVAQSIEATLAMRQDEYVVAQALLHAALPHLRQAPAPRVRITVPNDLGLMAMVQGDFSTAQALLEEALAASRAAGFRVDESISLRNLARVALWQRDYPTARALCQEAEVLARAAGDEWCVCGALNGAAQVALRQGDLSTARPLLEECVAWERTITRVGDLWTLAFSLDDLAQVAIAEGNYAEARTSLRESLLLRREQGSRYGVLFSLEYIATLAAAEADSRSAIQLATAVASLRDAYGMRQSPMGQAMLDKWLVPLRQALGEDAYQSAWDAGRAMSFDQAVELALAATEPQPETQSPTDLPDQAPYAPKQRVTELSPREQQVASLLAEGLTNRQIAERMVVTERTVAAHIEHILDKLGFASRHQVATWAADNGLRNGT